MKNELSNETSPYLLQHAHNPVHWQPWGEVALALAKTLDKPILVSIGYAACHWCHVMERESFENDATAAIMNEHFINIKIDREERPDIDHIYMDAVQAMTGSGGWPLNVFLTPDAKPFYGGTYFPPTPAHGRASFTDVLQSIHNAWVNKRDEMEIQAEKLIDHLKKSNNLGKLPSTIRIPTGENIFTKNDIQTISQNLLLNADTIDGGFGNAPKFPQTFTINCLLQAAYFLKDDKALAQAELSLLKMYNGGIYDQLAGGLCRYSTDGQWLAPHFEKMLYDNALFIIALSNAYLHTKKEVYSQAIEQTFHFIFAEMKNNTGGYYAAIDADSEGVEGKFYVWDKTEIDNILGEDATFFNAYYDITENGNWEEKNILRIVKPLSMVAKENNITIDVAQKIIEQSKQKLLAIRNKRIRPTTDDKILLSWNALLITALCKAYAALQKETYKIEATQLFNFLQEKFLNENGSYQHTYKNGEAKYPAFLDDYTYLVDAAIHLQEITGNEYYLHEAKKITQYIIDNFSDHESNFFFFTSAIQTDVVIRKIEIYDGATPSANAIMAKNLMYLSIIFDEKNWYNKSLTMIESLQSIIVKHPSSFGVWASTLMNIAAQIQEIAIVGENFTPQLNEILQNYLPNKILQATNKLSNLPMLENKQILVKTLLYLCHNYTCEKPYDNANNLIKKLNLA